MIISKFVFFSQLTWFPLMMIIIHFKDHIIHHIGNFFVKFFVPRNAPQIVEIY